MKIQSLILLVSVLLILTSCDTTDSYSTLSDVQTASATEASKKAGKPASGNTILDIAASNDDFSILAQAVLFAGLDDELSGKKQLTVFAPTNDAFAALLEALGLTAEELLSEENRELVTQTLLYHVANGKRESGDVVESDQIRTLQETFIKVKSEDGDFFVGNEENGFAKLITVDIEASNGVIHVIDAVLLPPTGNNAGDGEDDDSDERPEDTIVDIASSNEDFSILTEAVVFAGLADELSGDRQYTVFAPTNDAFVALLEVFGVTAEEFFVEENKELIRDVLLYHVAPGSRPAEDVVTSDKIRTVSKSFIQVKEEDGNFFVGNDNGFAQIIATDIFAKNGVIHGIDAVMLP
jgi:transforming growth factor-beta-induced protein